MTGIATPAKRSEPVAGGPKFNPKFSKYPRVTLPDGAISLLDQPPGRYRGLDIRDPSPRILNRRTFVPV